MPSLRCLSGGPGAFLLAANRAPEGAPPTAPGVSATTQRSGSTGARLPISNSLGRAGRRSADQPDPYVQVQLGPGAISRDGYPVLSCSGEGEAGAVGEGEAGLAGCRPEFGGMGGVLDGEGDNPHAGRA